MSITSTLMLSVALWTGGHFSQPFGAHLFGDPPMWGNFQYYTGTLTASVVPGNFTQNVTLQLAKGPKTFTACYVPGAISTFYAKGTQFIVLDAGTFPLNVSVPSGKILADLPNSSDPSATRRTVPVNKVNNTQAGGAFLNPIAFPTPKPGQPAIELLYPTCSTFETFQNGITMSLGSFPNFEMPWPGGLGYSEGGSITFPSADKPPYLFDFTATGSGCTTNAHGEGNSPTVTVSEFVSGTQVTNFTQARLTINQNVPL